MSDFENKMSELFPDEIVKVNEYHSFVNQPERIQISSQQDINDYDPNKLTTYFNFRVPLPRPAINVKSIQLARASIPNAVASLPDAETTFWFYTLPWEGTGTIRDDNAGVPGDVVYNFFRDGTLQTPVGGPAIGKVFFDGSGIAADEIVGLVLIGTDYYTFDAITATTEPFVAVPCQNGGVTQFWLTFTQKFVGLPRPGYLRYIRLLPSWSPPDLLDSFFEDDLPINRIYSDTGAFTAVEDLVNDLNIACQFDPLLDISSNEIPGKFKFVQNLIEFKYDTRYRKIIMTGSPAPPASIEFFYMPAPLDDPQWYAAANELQQRDSEATAQENYIFNEFGVNSLVQPYTKFRNLNTRLGFVYPIFPNNQADYDNMIRPRPANLNDTNYGAIYNLYDHLAPAYPDLVNTACVLLYTDIAGGSTLDTVANRNFLASIPMNTPNLGIGFHSSPLNNPLTKIPNQINEIYVEMRSDNGEPFYLPNNAIVSCEFILTYS